MSGKLLVLKRREAFYGIIGHPTGVMVGTDVICIGDTVTVKESENHGSSTNVVAIFGDNVSVMGHASDPISMLEIDEIVKSHKDLKDGDFVGAGGIFEVTSLKK